MLSVASRPGGIYSSDHVVIFINYVAVYKNHVTVYIDRIAV